MALDDIGQRRFKNATGTAVSFTSIDGVGPATAQKIKNADYSINAPKDIQDMSADELADKAGISYSRAEKAIRGAGGNPNQSKRDNTGSVSAAGITMPVGDFRVEAGDQDRARARNDAMSRSEAAVRQDERKRAPVTTDVEKWRKNKGQYDYPGVDTPTQDPNALPKDYKKGGPFDTTTPTPQEQARKGREQPSPERNTSAPESESTGLLNQDVSLAPEEAFEGVGSGSRNLSATNTPFGMASDDEADMAFLDAEADRRQESLEDAFSF